MGKQTKSKKPDFVGNGKVTPAQIAFIVDRYLHDNTFTQTRSTFRSEASHLISKSPVQAPKTLLSLGAILEEYIMLKEEKLLMGQERCRLEQEKLRVQNLLRGMEQVMSAYNNSANSVVTPPPLPPPHPATSGADVAVMAPAGYNPIPKGPSVMMSTTRPSNIQTDPTNFSTPVPNHATAKRKGSKSALDGPTISKRSRGSSQSKDANSRTQQNNAEKNQDNSLIHSVSHSSACDNAASGSPIQGSSVVKCLFNQKPPSPPTNSSVPKTPPIASSQTEKSISPVEDCSTAASSKDLTPQHIKSTNCTIISSERIQVSPNKQIAYYSIEKNHCFSTFSPAKTNLKRSNVKDHVKGKLDFGSVDMPITTGNQTPDGTSTSESDREGDLLEMDFPNLDALGLDFNLSDLLVDFDIGSDGLGLSSQQDLDGSPYSNSGSPPTSENLDTEAREVNQQFSSSMAGVLGQTDMNLIGPDSIAAVRSVTKCIILSPVKMQRRNGDQEN